jgi:MFS family permease
MAISPPAAPAAMAAAGAASTFETDVPARLDRLPFSRFHVMVVVALGIAWILDGLEVTLVGSLSVAIADPRALDLSATEVGLAGSAYIAGAVAGALLFGRLADRFGRRRLFTLTVLVYLIATMLTGLSWDVASFLVFRFFTGAGIGGEYAAVNSAIQELIPARWRGRTDLAVNGSFWLGAALGALGAVVLLDPRFVSPDLGWRAAFLIGGALAVIVIWLRRFVPESPRWLMTHGRAAEAETVVASIERRVGIRPVDGAALRRITLRDHHPTHLADVARALLRDYPRRTLLGLALMTAQAFCYNAVFFTYALMLTRFYGVAPAEVGWFILPFALGNFLGPLVLGPLFDTLGRRPMIAATYVVSGALMIMTGWLFGADGLDARTQTAAWIVIFFFASAGASAAYLTVGECFPLETRALTIALFYAFGTALGGLAGPALFGWLIEGGTRGGLALGYGLGGALMVGAGVLAWKIGIAAERQPLESIARPLSCPRE